ncbi:hypothetical protein JW868_02350 [Candidatus Woesearchaeota archaeon]|nr:hypothetical protein [Candidatus Woesearchaeota archaeon]
MIEVDTPHTIKRQHALLAVTAPFLADLGVTDAESLTDKLVVAGHKIQPNGSDTEGSGISAQEILEQSFDWLREKGAGQYFKNWLYNNYLRLELMRPGTDNPLHGRIPIFVNGQSIAFPGRSQKVNVHPSSNNSHISTMLLQQPTEIISPEVLDMIYYVFIQPNPAIMRYVQDTTNPEMPLYGLEDIMSSVVRRKIDPLMEGRQPFGDLTKWGNIEPMVGNAMFSDTLFSLEAALREVDHTASQLPGERSLNYLRQKDEIRHTVMLNKHIMALMFTRIYELLLPHALPVLKRYGYKGIPLFMEKTEDTCPASYIAQRIGRYSTLWKGFYLGDDGVFSGSGKELPTDGICNPSAFGALLGFLLNLQRKVTEDYAPPSHTAKKQGRESLRVDYKADGWYPFLLTEKSLAQRGLLKGAATIDDLAEYLIEKQGNNPEGLAGISRQDLESLKRFCYNGRIGITRIEPRIVELFGQDKNVYNGLRREDKTNRRWFAELEGKQIVFPHQLDGYMQMPQLTEGEADIRGSAFSLPTNNLDWLERWIKNGGPAMAGCSINKALSKMPDSVRKELIRERLAEVDSEQREAFYSFHDENLNSFHAAIGTTAHAIANLPMEGLVHYRTLELLRDMPWGQNAEAIPSNMYCEHPFLHDMKAPEGLPFETFRVSMHTDAHFFLRRPDGKYDLVVYDIKTNRPTPYPEHKYLMQTLFYGVVIQDIVEQELGIEIENIYTVLDKTAFYTGFGGKMAEPLPHETYRKREFAPITRWERGHPLREGIVHAAANAVMEMRMLVADPAEFVRYKGNQEYHGSCRKCFNSYSLACDRLAEIAGQGIPISEYFDSDAD